jgi:hypothetical protein
LLRNARGIDIKQGEIFVGKNLAERDARNIYLFLCEIKIWPKNVCEHFAEGRSVNLVFIF